MQIDCKPCETKPSHLAAVAAHLRFTQLQSRELLTAATKQKTKFKAQGSRLKA